MSMTRSLGCRGALLFSLGLLLAPPAAAQDGPADFGQKGQFVISGERLFGLVLASSSTSEIDDGVEVERTVSYTTFNLLMNPSQFTTYATPRIGFDYLVIDRLTLGGSLGFATGSGEVEQEAAGVSQTQDTGSWNAFLLAPRVGYAFMFTPVLGIWPRGGITFLLGGSEDEDGYPKTSSSRLALTMEVPFVITPLPHVGFTFAPTLDLGLTGSDEVTTLNDMGVETTTERDVVATDFGIQAGMFVYF
jgi:hypothetical protein